MLSDPEKKKLYDRFGHAAFDGSAREAMEAGAARTEREAFMVLRASAVSAQTASARAEASVRAAASEQTVASAAQTETAATGSSILKAEIWTICSEISSETCSAEKAAVSAAFPNRTGGTEAFMTAFPAAGRGSGPARAGDRQLR